MYWRQVTKAIPVSLFKEVRGHKQIAARALLIGWGIWILGGMMIFPLAFYGTNLGFDFEPSHPIGSAWSFMWMPVLGLANVHRSFPLAFAIGLPLIVGAMCGWLVARFHRNQRTVAVLLFAVSILLVDLLLFGPFTLTVGSSVASLFVGPIAANVGASILGVLLGGGLLRENSKTAGN